MKAPSPTPEQIRAAETLFLAMAHEQTVTPIVEAYQREILARREWMPAPKWREMMEEGGGKAPDDFIRRITSPDDAFLMSDADTKLYAEECNKAREAAGLKVESDEFCPMLVAKHARVLAENALIDAMDATIPGISRVRTAALSKRYEALELIRKLLAPFVRPASEILAEVAA